MHIGSFDAFVNSHILCSSDPLGQNKQKNDGVKFMGYTLTVRYIPIPLVHSNYIETFSYAHLHAFAYHPYIMCVRTL